MERADMWILAVLMAPCVLAAMPLTSANANESASPLFALTIADGDRQWELIAPSHETDPLNELRVILGNTLSMKAYCEGVLPFPDGAVLAKLAWKHVQSSDFAAAFVPGAATTLQIMVKDSKKYASTGGWGSGRFVDGKPVDEAQHNMCFGCDEANVKGHDFAFTRFAP